MVMIMVDVMPFLVPIGIVVLVIICIFISEKNKFVRYKNNIRNSKSSIDVYLKQRFDLIPNLVEVVKAYAKHEESLFKEVVEARNKYNQTESLRDGMITNNDLNKIVALGEDYPELKANENFLDLQKQLAKMESQLQAARRVYNSEVNTYNNAVMMVPSGWFAKLYGYKEEEYFEAKLDEKDNVEIKL